MRSSPRRRLSPPLAGALLIALSLFILGLPACQRTPTTPTPGTTTALTPISSASTTGGLTPTTSPFPTVTTTITTAAPDTTPPLIALRSPSSESEEMTRRAGISLDILDAGRGVDRTSIVLTVQGTAVAATITGSKPLFNVSYSPPQPFAYGDRVSVSITASDLAQPPNTARRDYGFQVAADRAPVLEVARGRSSYVNYPLQITLAATDPDGDPLTYLAENLPGGASFNAAAATFSWTPTEMGSYEVSFGVSDGILTDWQKMALTIVREPPLRLNLVYYGDHNPGIDAAILAARPEYIVANPPHGLWGEIYNYRNPRLLQEVAAYHAAGIKVVGYLTSGYEGRGSGSGLDPRWYTLEMNRKIIKNMAELDRVDGVFIDECSAYPNAAQKQYLKELTDLAHSYGLLTWGNPGQLNFDPWYFTQGGFDLMNSAEDWHGQALTSTLSPFAARTSATSQGQRYTLEQAVSLTLDAWSKGLAYVYICEMNYDTLPSWFEQYCARLQVAMRAQKPAL